MRARIALPLVVVSCLLCAAAIAEEEIRLAESPALSPDGSTLAFAWRGDLWTAPSKGGEARRLTTHPGRERAPRFSRDGKWIAFSADRTGSEQVYRIPVGGGEPERLTNHTEGSVVHDWFPDGRGLLVGGRRDHHWRRSERFFRKPLDARAAPVALFDGYGSSGRLSPDGRLLLFTREGSVWWRRGYTGSQAAQVWLFDIAARSFRRLSEGEVGERWPRWRPDGKGYWFAREDDGVWNLWECDLGSGDRVQRTRFEDDGVHFPTVSADGSTIVFRRLFDLWRLDVAPGAEPERIRLVYRGEPLRDAVRRETLTQASHVAFTDDGREIAFIAGGDLWVMDTELREPVQVTDTPEEERDPVFSPDHATIVFVSDAGGQPDLWRAERADPKRPWWRNREFKLRVLTNDPAPERAPRFTPDGRIAFTALRGDLWTMQPDGTDTRVLLESWNEPSYAFSPDGKWVAYAVEDDDFNRDIWIRAADGSGEPFNVSRHPDDESEPAWSPDGKLLAFAGQRTRDERDLHYVWLKKSDDDKSKRDRTLDKALEKMKGRPAGKADDEKKVSDLGKRLLRLLGWTPDGGKKKKKKKKDGPKLPEVKIDFERLHERVRRIPIPDTGESRLMFSPDSKRLAFRAKVDGREGTWTVGIPDEPKPKLLSGVVGERGRWLKEGDRIVWMVGGRPATLSAKGKATSLPFRVTQRVDLPRRYLATFDQAWRIMRDNFYDEALNNRDWNAMRAKYRPMAERCRTARELDDVVSLMLGELNGSHLGFWANDPGGWSAPGWRETTWHFGARFDPAWEGPGLKVRDVIRGTPASRAATRLAPGDVVLSADGKPLTRGVDPALALTGRTDREVELVVKNAKGKERRVKRKPTSFGAVRRLLYDHWVDATRRRVDELSGGTLGYVHVRGMSWRSFERFEVELYRVGHGKEGLLVDVRDNGGGFTADHLLTCLCQPVHAWTKPRGGGPGYPQGRMVYARWHKPVVVLCNQNSFSNAEIFAHAIKTLKRGRVVGVPTAGGVISTGGTSIMGYAGIRLPFRGWFVIGNGEDMECRGCVPDVVLWPEPGEMPRGVDRQLDRAVELLKEDVAAWKTRPREKLRYRSQR